MKLMPVEQWWRCMLIRNLDYPQVISRLLNVLIFFRNLHAAASSSEILLEILQIFLQDSKVVKREVGIRSWKSGCWEIAVQVQST